jgi:hypothetical protein
MSPWEAHSALCNRAVFSMYFYKPEVWAQEPGTCNLQGVDTVISEIIQHPHQVHHSENSFLQISWR